MSAPTPTQVREATDYAERWFPLLLALWTVALVLAVLSGPFTWWQAFLGGFIWACYSRSLAVKGRPIPKRPSVRKFALKSALPTGLLVGATWALFGEPVARSIAVGIFGWSTIGAALFVFILVPIAKTKATR